MNLHDEVAAYSDGMLSERKCQLMNEGSILAAKVSSANAAYEEGTPTMSFREVTAIKNRKRALGRAMVVVDLEIRKRKEARRAANIATNSPEQHALNRSRKDARVAGNVALSQDRASRFVKTTKALVADELYTRIWRLVDETFDAPPTFSEDGRCLTCGGTSQDRGFLLSTDRAHVVRCGNVFHTAFDPELPYVVPAPGAP